MQANPNLQPIQSRMRHGAASAPPTRSRKQDDPFTIISMGEMKGQLKLRMHNLSASKQQRMIGRFEKKKRAVTAGYCRQNTQSAWIPPPKVSPSDDIDVSIKNISDLLKEGISSKTRRSSITGINGRNRRKSIQYQPHTPSVQSNSEQARRLSATGSRKSSLVGSMPKMALMSSPYTSGSNMALKEENTDLSLQLSSLRRPGGFPSQRSTFKFGHNPDTSNSLIPKDAGGKEERFSVRFFHRTAKSNKGLKITIDPLEGTLRLKEKQQADQIVRLFKQRGVKVDKNIVEKGLIHPPNIVKKEIEYATYDNNDFETVKTNEPGHVIIRRKKKELKKRSESTHILHVTSLVVEAKDDDHKGRFQSLHDTAFMDVKHVKPKTNSWWTRAEYQAFHDNITEYRLKKKEEKLKSNVFFHPTGIAEAARKQKVHRSVSQPNAQTESRQIVWHDRLQQKKLPERSTDPVFTKRNVFSGRSSSRQSIENAISPIPQNASMETLKKNLLLKTNLATATAIYDEKRPYLVLNI